MTTLPGYGIVMSDRVRNTVLPNFEREVEKACVKNYQMLALIEANGRKVMNDSGESIAWRVQHNYHKPEGYTGETTRSYSRVNLWTGATLPWRGYLVTDAMKFLEFQQAKGPESLVKVFDGMSDTLTESMKFALAREPYVNGEAVGNTKGWHGMDTMFNVNGQTLNVSTGVARTANALDPVGNPYATYAGISCVLGSTGGDQEAGKVWPLGHCSPDYDFWSPLVVNYTSSYFGGTTWAANCAKALRFGILNSMRNGSKDDHLTNIALASDLYYDFANYLEGKQRLVPNSGPTSLLKLGFTDVINFDNKDVSLEYGAPTGYGYGYSINSIELRSLYPQLFNAYAPEVDTKNSQYNFNLDTLSNLKFKRVRNFVQWAPLA